MNEWLPVGELIKLGGIVTALYIVLLIIQRVVPKRYGNGASGEKPTEFWQMEFDKLENVMRQEVIPILAKQTEILRGIEQTQERLAGTLNEMLRLDYKRVGLEMPLPPPVEKL